MKEEQGVEVGQARLAAGRAVVPIVRTYSATVGKGGFFRAEPVGILVAGEGWAVLLSREGAEVPDDVVDVAAHRARQALER
ncbi:hypothetical protein [Methanofollis fontis]|uniref:Uncharacterized protein n=1 Tax=Methanofollis fontis TaxID=2052832 RepID=A0A483CRT6_9EURY|nr:hypothetical protein [Methanofollis fontis]TAJ45548.1 hypothetical protein CUJ86_02140 [Methanofollis fontis]